MLITSLKSLIGKLKEIIKDEPASLKEIFAISLMTFPSAIKKQIKFDDDSVKKDYLYKRDSLKLYVYNACDSIQYCGISFLKYVRDLDKIKDAELNEGIAEVLGRNFEIEARLSLRRLMELFLEVRNFKLIDSTDRESKIRQYYLIRVLQAYHQRNDLQKYYANVDSIYVKNRIEEIKKEISELKESFYLTNLKLEERNIKHLIKPFRNVFDQSLPLMSEMEKILMGESYQQYAESSNVIHAFSGLAKFDLKNYHQEIGGIYSRMHILSICILKDLAEIGKDIVSKDLVEAIKSLKSDLADVYKLSVGDLVIVRKQIKAQVVEIFESKYGVKKYKVNYLEKEGDFAVRFEEDEFLLKDLRKIDQ